MGWKTISIQNELNDTHHFQKLLTDDKTQYMTLGLVTDLVERERNIRLTINVKQLGTSSTDLHGCTGNLLVYLRKDSLENTPPQYGDLILIKTRIQMVEPVKNPEAFDFKKYLHYQNVHYQSFINYGKLYIIKTSQGNWLRQYAVNWQKDLISLLKKHLTTERELAVGSALLLGYRGAIDDELKNAYVQTGSMHILAVSGMHIVIIFQLLTGLLSVYKSGNPRYQWSKAVFAIILIWLFALLTGLSASVLRAAVMSTFLGLGKAMQRHVNIYNVLAASGFCLLLFNPYFLFDVGFQLSYGAVIGIVYFQPKISKLIIIEKGKKRVKKPQNASIIGYSKFITQYVKFKINNIKFLHVIWDALSIGFAAQIAVTPISLYYFHQFPTYFWLSGLLAVPVSSLALYIGIFLFFFDKIPFIGVCLGKMLFGSIWLMNEIIFLMQKLPYSVINGIWVSLTTTIWLYIALAGIVFTLQTKRLRYFFIPLSIAIVLSITYVLSDRRNKQQKQIIIYCLYKNSLMDYVVGQKCYVFMKKNEKTFKTDNSLKYASENHRNLLTINELQTFNFNEYLKLPNLIYHKGISQLDTYRLATIDNLPSDVVTLPFNAVVIRENARFSMAELVSKMTFKEVIFDGSNSRKRVEKWQNECQLLNISSHDILTQGAWIRNL